MDSRDASPAPQLKCDMRWNDSAPSTPRLDIAGSRPGFQQSRPMGIIGGNSLSSMGESSVGDVSSVATGPLASLQKYTGPLSSSMGMLPTQSAALAGTPKDPPLSYSSIGELNGQLARRQQARQQRVRPLSRVSGLSYISVSDMAAKLDEASAAGRQGVIIDTRRSADYTRARITSAANMNVSTTLAKRKTFTVDRLLEMQRVADEQRRLVASWKDAPWVVLYGDGAPEETASEDTPLVLLARKFMSEAPASCGIYVLQGGFVEFAHCQGSLCESSSEAAAAGVGPIPPHPRPSGAPAAAGASLPAGIQRASTNGPPMACPKPMIKIDHPMLRTMRQTPGGGFDPSDIVAMRLPHDFSPQHRGSQRLQALPAYLSKVADPATGPAMLTRLFGRIDASESRRMSSMIENNGMVTAKNMYTISVGLELGSKNRYTNIFPFDSNRVRLRSIRRPYEEEAAAAATGLPVSPDPEDAHQYSGTDGRGAGLPHAAGARGRGASRPISLGVTGNKQSHRGGRMKRSSHQAESKSKNQLLTDDADSTGSELELFGSAAAGADKSDYVNASYISYFDGPLYIATQGPLPETVGDFWRMVWEERVHVVVMLTKEYENGRPKCHRYWPAQIGDAAIYGDLRVEWQAEAQHPDDASVVARRFRLTRPSVSNATAYITHLQYLGWPDHGAPENSLGVLRLVHLARQAQAAGEAGGGVAARVPMVVHCSAGCGRTGAFCVIDTVMEMSRTGSGDAVAGAVSVRASAEDADGDAHMPEASNTSEPAQPLSASGTPNQLSMYTDMVPQALRSKVPHAAPHAGGDSASHGWSPAGKVSSGVTDAEGCDDRRSRRSLMHWNEEPPAEYHDDLVFMVVSRFRELRVTMVQTIRQFVFCHEALAWAALGAGPRPIEHVIDRRLVAEWNRVNYPELSEADCADVTFLLRGRQEMVQAMLSSDIGGSAKGSGSGGAAAMSSAAGSAGRASIDVVSGSAMLTDDDNPMTSGPPAVKRSNTVGPGRRGFFASLFRPAEPAAAEASGPGASSSAAPGRQGSGAADADGSGGPSQEQRRRPPPPLRMGASLSSGPMLSGAPSMLPTHAPIAEEASGAMETEDAGGLEQLGAGTGALTLMTPPAAARPLFGSTRAGGARPRPPSLVAPPATCSTQESPDSDYFGMASIAVESPAALASAGSGPNLAGILGARAESPGSPAGGSRGSWGGGALSMRAFSTDPAQFPASKQRFIPASGTYPQGFVAAGAHCGVKKRGRPDLAVMLSDRPATASAVFTTNQFCAAPVQFDRGVLNDARGLGRQAVRAVVVNSGCANAVTGQQGLVDAQAMAEAGSRLVQALDARSGSAPVAASGPARDTLVMSTGVIGQTLPIDKISAGVQTLEPELGDAHESWMRAAIAHMTTDTFPKLLSREAALASPGRAFRMAGITKGAGMIHPNMATLLGTVCTDVAITQPLLDQALAHAVARSFNAISIDGDMSTNDTIAVLANGAAAGSAGWVIDAEDSHDYRAFRDELTSFMAELASLVVRDGEGATKFLTIEVAGAQSFADAKQVASTVATSSLVKTAFYGQDANWGRILCAVGYAGVPLDTTKVNLAIHPGDGSTPLALVRAGEPLLPVDEARASEILKQEDMLVRVELGLGSEEARVYTCDLSHDYVSINADYRS
ncbi:glutamate N-acetyltransferase [Coemansia biformis]|uniref:Arginine biosynthesis bifunctional protein ArgJ, mitochondrial n=1 Tax=Coemansia biformis TaxID=1286918 RepID=A0A9W7YEA3_9FUNG|nr:glutamate N-acetyltransferase [Coemansia biformis]